MNFQTHLYDNSARLIQESLPKSLSCKATGSIRETIVNNDQPQKSSTNACYSDMVIPLKTKNPQKVYTGKGDHGWCILLSGERVMKDDEQVEACGDIDELNSVLGLLASMLPKNALWLSSEVERIQHTLFVIGALVITGPDSSMLKHLKPISGQDILSLEISIDVMEDRLSAIQHFIIPGGHVSAAQTHFARSVCRRAERHVIKHLKKFNLENLPDSMKNALVYLNRLSDYLFVLGRFCNSLQKVADKCIKNTKKAANGNRKVKISRGDFLEIESLLPSNGSLTLNRC